LLCVVQKSADFDNRKDAPAPFAGDPCRILGAGERALLVAQDYIIHDQGSHRFVFTRPPASSFSINEVRVTFSLDACRHGGMTELEEAELTDGQGRALSAHKSRAYETYAKRTMERALAATRKRHAHRIAGETNAQRTEFRNGQRTDFRNDKNGPKGAAK
jgi:hypothetical protein